MSLSKQHIYAGLSQKIQTDMKANKNSQHILSKRPLAVVGAEIQEKLLK